MQEKIWAILPYKELLAIAQRCKEEHGLRIQLQEGHIDGAIPVAKRAVAQGAEVIISRGGTAALIRKHVDVPVVEIKVSYLDTLRILHPFQGQDETLLIVGFRNAVNRCRSVGKVLGLRLLEIIIPYEDTQFNMEKVRVNAQKLVQTQGIGTLVGDKTAVVYLGDLCRRSALITSGEEDVMEAILEAENILQVKDREKEKSQRLQTILDFINDGVISTDEQGVITVFNPAARRIFELSDDQARGLSIRDIFPGDVSDWMVGGQNPELERIQKSPQGSIMLNHIPIRVNNETKGAVVTFKEIAQIQGAEQKIREKLYSKGLVTKYSFKDILGKDPRVNKLVQMARDYSRTDATVLIQGESGTGKELFAQGIHADSARAKGAFVAVNCAALPPHLLESELFGYVEGAFTGAVKGGKVGLFEMAHKGTLFLDEIGEIDKALQARFLRVLEEKQVMRIGSDKIIHTDVRVIAATNRNLKELVEEDHFRSDLYYRLNVLNLRMVALRDRKGDILQLAKLFIRHCNKTHGTQVEELAPELVQALEEYWWPGNIRELRNVMERLVLTARKEYIRLEDVDLIMEELSQAHQSNVDIPQEFLAGTLEQIKGKVAAQVLIEERFNKTKAAKRLGIDRSTLNRIL